MSRDTAIACELCLAFRAQIIHKVRILRRFIGSSMKSINFLPVPKVLCLLIAITFLAWSLLIYYHWQMNTLPASQVWMLPRSAWQWQVSDFVIVYVIWSVMMAAMMLPFALPMIQVFSNIMVVTSPLATYLSLPIC
ncbi:hypothetical protein [Bathymodiolus platifrons methanotrophic gill symbiont]|uniref:hypothetical protein n=1 Tax=Bathymodiolus platifrons methanotrophic gill symbiont TaxID=113268 RepID=UPI001124EC31|nr:hypothetical protein [Bathymodiolus platifrons methanotrophic gill symbiont]